MIELINRITQEKVWCQWDLDGAKSFIKRCVPDLPDNIIVNIIFGNGKLIFTDDGCVEYDDNKNLDSLNYQELLDVKLKSIKQECLDWSKSVYNVISFFKQYDTFQYYDYILNENVKTDLENIKNTFENTIKCLENLIIEIKKVQYVCINLCLQIDFNFNYYISTLEKVKKCILNKDSDPKTSLDVYIQKELEMLSIDKITPTKEYCDAGWIAPNGDYYGLNGEVFNLLHIKISNLLVKSNIIKESSNPDNYLEKNGWIKQHDNNIDSYYMYGDTKNYITKNQRKTIFNILKSKYNNVNLRTISGNHFIELNEFIDMDTYDFEQFFNQ